MRNIIYLDVEKMYSLSSQIFEGVTEYIVSERATSAEEEESQKGPVGSGKVLGDILRNEERVSEKRFLVDHSYVLFENKLIDDGRVVELSESNSSTSIRLNSFVKVSGRIAFNDLVAIKNTIRNFNSTGKALASVTNFNELSQLRSKIDLPMQAEERKQVAARIKQLSNSEALAKSSGLFQDPNFLSDLVSVLDYGFQDQLEGKIRIGDKIFSADLKRECLRERENVLIRKYSRKSEVEFVIFGIVTQLDHDTSLKVDELGPDAKMKEAIMALVSHMSNVESTFTGRLSNEVIIDPIAIYSQIS